MFSTKQSAFEEMVSIEISTMFSRSSFNSKHFEYVRSATEAIECLIKSTARQKPSSVNYLLAQKSKIKTNMWFVIRVILSAY